MIRIPAIPTFHRFKLLFKLFLGTAQVFCVGAFLFFVSFLFDRDVFVPEAVEAVAAADVPEVQSSSGSFDQYAVLIKGRNLFAPMEVTAVMASSRAAVDVGFRVAGLMLGKVSSVVLEQSGGGAVFFLSEGERQGEIYVRKIAKEAVELEVAGQLVRLDVKGRML